MPLKDILQSKLGFGAAPLGNMFRDIPEEEALATVEAAWNDGIRYYDNAPFYGAGVAEIRMGKALIGKPRDQYVISTKVGRLILDEIEDVSARDLGEKGDVFKYGLPNKIVNDYTEDATYRSIEDSLKRYTFGRTGLRLHNFTNARAENLLRPTYRWSVALAGYCKSYRGLRRPQWSPGRRLPFAGTIGGGQLG